MVGAIRKERNAVEITSAFCRTAGYWAIPLKAWVPQRIFAYWLSKLNLKA